MIREVAQVVAHLVWDQRVAGSNPVFPTLKGAFWAPFFVIPARFERATVSLEVKCSIQLSYGIQ